MRGPALTGCIRLSPCPYCRQSVANIHPLPLLVWALVRAIIQNAISGAPLGGNPPNCYSSQAHPAEPRSFGRGLCFSTTIWQIRRLARVSWYIRLLLRWNAPAMPTHKSRVGQLVQLAPAISRSVPGGSYEIAKQLPENGGEFEYRIKAINEHERRAGKRAARSVVCLFRRTCCNFAVA
jgi:hypothetical protein